MDEDLLKELKPKKICKRKMAKTFHFEYSGVTFNQYLNDAYYSSLTRVRWTNTPTDHPREDEEDVPF